MIPEVIYDHFDAAIDRLIEHFSGEDKTVLRGLVGAYVAQIQDLEDTTWQVIWGRLLDPAPGRTEQAEGVQLDTLGQIVGVDREGLNDDEYREAIRLQIIVNKSFGTPEDLLRILRLAVGPTGTIDLYREEYYHVFYAYLSGISDNLAFTIYRAFQRARAAGTRAILEYHTDGIAESSLFRWANESTGGLNGFGNEETSGGRLTSEQG